MELSELTLENVGSWPIGAKIGALLFVLVVICSLGGYFLVKPQFLTLEKKQREQMELQKTFEFKAGEAAVLPVYEQQIIQMRKLFKVMLQQLPTRAEIPDLVEDISQMGVANGLTFDLIRPDSEKKKDFYIELPIQMTVLGDYHQLAAFISDLAGLKRIVTIGDFTVERQKMQKQPTQTLLMRMTANTYRYTPSPIDKLIIGEAQ